MQSFTPRSASAASIINYTKSVDPKALKAQGLNPNNPEIVLDSEYLESSKALYLGKTGRGWQMIGGSAGREETPEDTYKFAELLDQKVNGKTVVQRRGKRATETTVEGEEGTKKEESPEFSKSYDVTFSPQKWASFLAEFGGARAAEAVKEAMIETVEYQIARLEKEGIVAAPQGRTEFDGNQVSAELATAKLTASYALHYDSRQGDPNWHLHCQISTVAFRDSDGRPMALNEHAAFYLDQKFRSREADMYFAYALEKRGFNPENAAKYFTPEQYKQFSKSREAIEDRLEDLGIKATSAASEIANRDIRKTKSELSHAEMQGNWKAQIAEKGWGEQFASENVVKAAIPSRLWQDKERESLSGRVIDVLMATNLSVSEKKVLETIQQYIVDNHIAVHPDEAREICKQTLGKMIQFEHTVDVKTEGLTPIAPTEKMVILAARTAAKNNLEYTSEMAASFDLTRAFLDQHSYAEVGAREARAITKTEDRYTTKEQIASEMVTMRLGQELLNTRVNDPNGVKMGEILAESLTTISNEKREANAEKSRKNEEYLHFNDTGFRDIYLKNLNSQYKKTTGQDLPEGKADFERLVDHVGYADAVNICNRAIVASKAGATLQTYDFPYSQQQIDAVRAMGDDNQMVILQGVPGAGKTTILQPLFKALKEQGKTVIATSTQTAAANKMVEAGADVTCSIERLRIDYQNNQLKLDSNTEIFVDEASQASMRDQLFLFEMAKATGCRIREIGDEKQYKSVGAGTIFANLHQSAKDAGAFAELTASNRFQTAQTRTMFECLNKNDWAGTLKALEETSSLDFAKRGELIQKIAVDYANKMQELGVSGLNLRDNLKEADLKNMINAAIITTGTNDSVAALNLAVQKELTARGLVDANGPSLTFESVRQNGEKMGARTFYEGEKIVIKSNNTKADVNNSDVGFITSIKDQFMHVAVMATGKDGEVLDGTMRHVQLDSRTFKCIDLGHARTGVGSQGQDVRFSFTMLDKKEELNALLVMLTRAKEENHVYIDADMLTTRGFLAPADSKRLVNLLEDKALKAGQVDFAKGEELRGLLMAAATNINLGKSSAETLLNEGGAGSKMDLSEAFDIVANMSRESASIRLLRPDEERALAVEQATNKFLQGGEYDDLKKGQYFRNGENVTLSEFAIQAYPDAGSNFSGQKQSVVVEIGSLPGVDADQAEFIRRAAIYNLVARVSGENDLYYGQFSDRVEIASVVKKDGEQFKREIDVELERQLAIADMRAFAGAGRELREGEIAYLVENAPLLAGKNKMLIGDKDVEKVIAGYANENGIGISAAEIKDLALSALHGDAVVMLENGYTTKANVQAQEELVSSMAAISSKSNLVVVPKGTDISALAEREIGNTVFVTNNPELAKAAGNGRAAAVLSSFQVSTGRFDSVIAGRNVVVEGVEGLKSTDISKLVGKLGGAEGITFTAREGRSAGAVNSVGVMEQMITRVSDAALESRQIGGDLVNRDRDLIKNNPAIFVESLLNKADDRFTHTFNKKDGVSGKEQALDETARRVSGALKAGKTAVAIVSGNKDVDVMNGKVRDSLRAAGLIGDRDIGVISVKDADGIITKQLPIAVGDKLVVTKAFDTREARDIVAGEEMKVLGLHGAVLACERRDGTKANLNLDEISNFRYGYATTAGNPIQPVADVSVHMLAGKRADYEAITSVLGKTAERLEVVAYSQNNIEKLRVAHALEKSLGETRETSQNKALALDVSSSIATEIREQAPVYTSGKKEAVNPIKGNRLGEFLVEGNREYSKAQKAINRINSLLYTNKAIDQESALRFFEQATAEKGYMVTDKRVLDTREALDGFVSRNEGSEMHHAVNAEGKYVLVIAGKASESQRVDFKLAELDGRKGESRELMDGEKEHIAKIVVSGITSSGKEVGSDDIKIAFCNYLATTKIPVRDAANLSLALADEMLKGGSLVRLQSREGGVSFVTREIAESAVGTKAALENLISSGRFVATADLGRSDAPLRSMDAQTIVISNRKEIEKAAFEGGAYYARGSWKAAQDIETGFLQIKPGQIVSLDLTGSKPGDDQVRLIAESIEKAGGSLRLTYDPSATGILPEMIEKLASQSGLSMINPASKPANHVDLAVALRTGQAGIAVMAESQGRFEAMAGQEGIQNTAQRVVSALKSGKEAYALTDSFNKRQLNAAIRSGFLDKHAETRTLTAAGKYRKNTFTLEVAAGERLALTERLTIGEHTFDKGTVFTVKGFSEHGLVGEIAGQSVTIGAEHYTAFEYAYTSATARLADVAVVAMAQSGIDKSSLQRAASLAGEDMSIVAFVDRNAAKTLSAQSVARQVDERLESAPEHQATFDKLSGYQVSAPARLREFSSNIELDGVATMSRTAAIQRGATAVKMSLGLDVADLRANKDEDIETFMNIVARSSYAAMSHDLPGEALAQVYAINGIVERLAEKGVTDIVMVRTEDRVAIARLDAQSMPYMSKQALQIEKNFQRLDGAQAGPVRLLQSEEAAYVLSDFLRQKGEDAFTKEDILSHLAEYSLRAGLAGGAAAVKDLAEEIIKDGHVHAASADKFISNDQSAIEASLSIRIQSLGSRASVVDMPSGGQPADMFDGKMKAGWFRSASVVITDDERVAEKATGKHLVLTSYEASKALLSPASEKDRDNAQAMHDRGAIVVGAEKMKAAFIDAVAAHVQQNKKGRLQIIGDSKAATGYASGRGFDVARAAAAAAGTLRAYAGKVKDSLAQAVRSNAPEFIRSLSRSGLLSFKKDGEVKAAIVEKAANASNSIVVAGRFESAPKLNDAIRSAKGISIFAGHKLGVGDQIMAKWDITNTMSRGQIATIKAYKTKTDEFQIQVGNKKIWTPRKSLEGGLNAKTGKVSEPVKLAHALSTHDLSNADHEFDHAITSTTEERNLVTIGEKAKRLEVVAGVWDSRKIGHEARIDKLAASMSVAKEKLLTLAKDGKQLDIEASRKALAKSQYQSYEKTKDFRETDRGQEIERTRSRGRGR